MSPPANGCVVVGADLALKAATAEQHPQPCSKQQPAVVDEVICIDDDDDDDDDAVLVVTNPPTVASPVSTSSASDHKKPSADAVQPVESLLSSVRSSPINVDGDSAAVACVNTDTGTAIDTEQFTPSAGDLATDNTGCLSTPPGSAVRPQPQSADESTSQCSSPSSRQVLRLERLLEVGCRGAAGFFFVRNIM